MGRRQPEDQKQLLLSPFTVCSLKRRLEKSLSSKDKYQETIKVDVENDYVEKLDEEELRETKDETQSYVPHHPVIKPHRPEKVRRVCDVAANFRVTSLNDMLITNITSCKT